MFGSRAPRLLGSRLFAAYAVQELRASSRFGGCVGIAGIAGVAGSRMANLFGSKVTNPVPTPTPIFCHCRRPAIPRCGHCSAGRRGDQRRRSTDRLRANCMPRWAWSPAAGGRGPPRSKQPQRGTARTLLNEAAGTARAPRGLAGKLRGSHLVTARACSDQPSTHPEQGSST